MFSCIILCNINIKRDYLVVRYITLIFVSLYSLCFDVIDEEDKPELDSACNLFNCY